MPQPRAKAWLTRRQVRLRLRGVRAKRVLALLQGIPVPSDPDEAWRIAFAAVVAAVPEAVPGQDEVRAVAPRDPPAQPASEGADRHVAGAHSTP